MATEVKPIKQIADTADNIRTNMALEQVAFSTTADSARGVIVGSQIHRVGGEFVVPAISSKINATTGTATLQKIKAADGVATDEVATVGQMNTAIDGVESKGAENALQVAGATAGTFKDGGAILESPDANIALLKSSPSSGTVVVESVGTQLVSANGNVKLVLNDASIGFSGKPVFHPDAELYNQSATLGQVKSHEYPYSASKTPTGWDDPANVVINYNATNRTVTLTPVSGTISMYWQGKKVAGLSDLTTWTSEAHAVPVGQQSFYLYYNGSAVVWSNTPWTFEKGMIALVYRDGVNFCLRECHGMAMDHDSHRELHDNVGTYLKSGGDMSGYTLASTTATNRRPQISEALIFDEDCPTILPALTTNAYSRLALTSTATATVTVDNTEIVAVDGGTGRPFYNQWNGSAYVQTAMANNEYQKIFVMAVPVSASADCQKVRFVFMQGQTSSTDLAVVRAITPASISLGNLSAGVSEYAFIGEVIIRATTNSWQLTEVKKLTGGRFQQVSAPPAVIPSAQQVFAVNGTVSANATFTGNVLVPVADQAGEAVQKSQLDSGLAGKVSTTGNESISGVKTFQNAPIVPPASASNEVPQYGQLTAHIGAGGGAHSAVVANGSNGFMSGSDKGKLDSIAVGATANSTDVQLRDRSTHTGSQAISTVTGLQTALDGKQPLATDLTNFVANATVNSAGDVALTGTVATDFSTTHSIVSQGTAWFGTVNTAGGMRFGSNCYFTEANEWRITGSATARPHLVLYEADGSVIFYNSVAGSIGSLANLQQTVSWDSSGNITAKVTGISPVNTPIADGNTIATAVSRLQGQINNISQWLPFSGALTFNSSDYALYEVEGRITGTSSTSAITISNWDGARMIITETYNTNNTNATTNVYENAGHNKQIVVGTLGTLRMRIYANNGSVTFHCEVDTIDVGPVFTRRRYDGQIGASMTIGLVNITESLLQYRRIR